MQGSPDAGRAPPLLGALARGAAAAAASLLHSQLPPPPPPPPLHSGGRGAHAGSLRRLGRARHLCSQRRPLEERPRTEAGHAGTARCWLTELLVEELSKIASDRGNQLQRLLASLLRNCDSTTCSVVCAFISHPTKLGSARPYSCCFCFHGDIVSPGER